jgi:hypothetical protein
MAEGDGFLFNNFKHQVMEAAFNLLSDTIRVMLLNGYTPNIDTHTTKTEAIAGATGECSDGAVNYTAGGAALDGKAVTLESGSDLGKFDANNLTWTALLLTTPASAIPSHVVMYDDTHASELLIAYWVLGTTVTNGGNYTLAWHTDGIITLT